MQTIIIDSKNNFNYISDIAKKELCDKFSFDVKNNKLIFNSEDSAFLQLKVSEILTEYIINFEEEILLKSLICLDYAFLNTTEKTNILNTAIKLIKNHDNDFLRMLILLKRRFLIKQNILEYLNDDNYLNLEGFIQFRLSSYKKMLLELIQKVVEDYKLQKEYKEFINMLKSFVESQRNRSPKLHVIFEENGEYLILDEKNKNITKNCFEEFNETKEQNNLNNEDVLISSLITLAPRKLFLHFEGENYNKKIVNTIEQIFENKVFVSSEPLLELVR